METKPIALVIDDDEDQNIIFSAALERAGYTVEPAFNGKMAQKLLAELAPAIVILDLHLPDFNGDIILKQMRSNPRLKDVRVIVVTSDPSFAATLDPRPELILLKPVGFAQLSQLASRLTQKANSPSNNTPQPE